MINVHNAYQYHEMKNWLILLHAGYFPFVCRLLILKISFLKNYFRNTIRVSNSLDPDQARHSVGPNLDSNCLQRLSADGIICDWQVKS